MHQRQLTAAQAFTVLLRASSESNIKVRHVAETLCHPGALTEQPVDPVTRPGAYPPGGLGGHHFDRPDLDLCALRNVHRPCCTDTHTKGNRTAGASAVQRTPTNNTPTVPQAEINDQRVHTSHRPVPAERRNPLEEPR